MKKLIKWLDVNFEAVLMVVFFTMMIILITIHVVLRFVFKTGFSWGEEVARILFLWMSFSSFGYLTRNSRHVRVGFLVGKIKDDVQKKILFICDVLFLIFSVAGLKAVINLCIDAAKYHDKLISIPWNYNVLYLAGVLGFFMMVMRNIQILIWKTRNWNSDLERFINYDGIYYDNNRVFCQLEEKDFLEKKEELLEKYESGQGE